MSNPMSLWFLRALRLPTPGIPLEWSRRNESKAARPPRLRPGAGCEQWWQRWQWCLEVHRVLQKSSESLKPNFAPDANATLDASAFAPGTLGPKFLGTRCPLYRRCGHKSVEFFFNLALIWHWYILIPLMNIDDTIWRKLTDFRVHSLAPEALQRLLAATVRVRQVCAAQSDDWCFCGVTFSRDTYYINY